MERERQNLRPKPVAPEPRRPYVKPACISEPIYETLALACGKVPGGGGHCHGAPRRS